MALWRSVSLPARSVTLMLPVVDGPSMAGGGRKWGKRATLFVGGCIGAQTIYVKGSMAEQVDLT